MLKDNSQLKLSLSPYQGIYEVIIPNNHLLRRIKENIDFSFVNPMLRKQYCEHFGRPAKEPEMMFKLLFLKKLYDLVYDGFRHGVCLKGSCLESESVIRVAFYGKSTIF